MRAARVDRNQALVVQALRKAGGIVTHTHTLGKGVCDLLVSFKGHWLAFEVKVGKAKLTSDELKWGKAQKAPVHVVRSPEEAVAVLRRVKS